MTARAASYDMLLGGILDVKKYDDRAAPDDASPAAHPPSLRYAAAESMCRYPVRRACCTSDGQSEAGLYFAGWCELIFFLEQQQGMEGLFFLL